MNERDTSTPPAPPFPSGEEGQAIRAEIAEGMCGDDWPGHTCILNKGHGGGWHRADCGQRWPVGNLEVPDGS